MALLFYSGKGIQDIRRTGGDGTPGSTDIYTIFYTDDSVSAYSVLNGKDGSTPRIGDNGNWWLGTVDTGVPAQSVPDLSGYSTKVQADQLYKPIGYAPDLSGYSTKVQADQLYKPIGYAPDLSAYSTKTVADNLYMPKSTSLFSGNYADLSGKPSLFSGSYNDLSNKPALFSGNYTDLINKPTIPNVYAWALAVSKPGYLYSEISGTPDLSGYALSTAILTNTNQLVNGAGFITSGSIPTSLPASDVYSWAKAVNKPSYGWAEIGNAPTNVSQFSNDSGYATASTNRWYDGWVTNPGYDANTIAGSKSGFSYSNNCPQVGTLVNFDGGGYGLQLSSHYIYDNISFRTRNGDAGSWNAWRAVWHDGNFSPSNYLPLAGGTMSGSLSMGANTIYANILQHTNGRIILYGNLYIDSFNGNQIYNQYYSNAGIQNFGHTYNNGYGIYNVGEITASGTVTASNFIGSGAGLTGTAPNLTTGYSAYAGQLFINYANTRSNWYWSGQGGQPNWLWGGSDGTNMYLYNPSNFSVSYANTAGSANSAGYSTYLNSSNYIQQRGSQGDWNTDFQSNPAGTLSYGGDVGANTSNNPGGSWWVQQNFRHTNSSNYWGVQVAWGWEDNANKLATRNISGGTFSPWVYYINSANIGSQSVNYATNAANAGTASTANYATTAGSAGSATFANLATRVNCPDGDRNASTILPTTNNNAVRFDFISANTCGTGGNYAGVMTYAPWLGTTASTGDASYQLVFGSTAVNGGGVPMLRIRKGIDSTWNSFYTIWHEGNFTPPTSLPASDVYSWAKAASKPSYSYSEVGAQAPISLTTSGTSGVATFAGNVLNIPNYLTSGSVMSTIFSGASTTSVGFASITFASSFYTLISGIYTVYMSGTAVLSGTGTAPYFYFSLPNGVSMTMLAGVGTGTANNIVTNSVCQYATSTTGVLKFPWVGTVPPSGATVTWSMSFMCN